jgi:hypothetical protein
VVGEVFLSDIFCSIAQTARGFPSHERLNPPSASFSPPAVWTWDTPRFSTEDVKRHMIVSFQKVIAVTKGGSRVFFDFARIAISAASEQDLEGPFSP